MTIISSSLCEHVICFEKSNLVQIFWTKFGKNQGQIIIARKNGVSWRREEFVQWKMEKNGEKLGEKTMFESNDLISHVSKRWQGVIWCANSSFAYTPSWLSRIPSVGGLRLSAEIKTSNILGTVKGCSTVGSFVFIFYDLKNKWPFFVRKHLNSKKYASFDIPFSAIIWLLNLT